MLSLASCSFRSTCWVSSSTRRRAMATSGAPGDGGPGPSLPPAGSTTWVAHICWVVSSSERIPSTSPVTCRRLDSILLCSAEIACKATSAPRDSSARVVFSPCNCRRRTPSSRSATNRRHRALSKKTSRCCWLRADTRVSVPSAVAIVMSHGRSSDVPRVVTPGHPMAMSGPDEYDSPCCSPSKPLWDRNSRRSGVAAMLQGTPDTSLITC
mmetsp:Transcript_17115/g.36978  ORF Transcript_17115/g.36978 Transcript_17115/m.36978 type:complete len:211 (-) Transcript_17115:16-648(-)